VLAEADRIAVEWLHAASFLCNYCGHEIAQADRTIDHVQPVSRGGKHTPDNLRRACRSCNSRKQTRPTFYP
jgi:5-methylcytosine-specific restriction endonuclease McrA